MNNFYEFNPEDAFRFAQFVGAKAFRKGDELTFKHCPVCDAKSDKNTFSINLKTGQCQCLRSTCSFKGNMITLAQEFGFDLGHDVNGYYNINGYKDKYRDIRHYVPKVEAKAIEYLKSRGISEKITRKYEISMKKDSSDVIAFPFKDENGALRYVKYRNTVFIKGESNGSKEWTLANCQPILFGMNHCNIENRELVITEGQIDSLSLAEAGVQNALSVPNGKNAFTWIPFCWNFIQQYDTIVVFGDREDDSMTLLDDLKRRFYRKRIKHIRIEDYKDCKDANEILLKYGPKYLKQCVNNAIEIPISGLIDLADIKPLNRYEIPKLQTGFSYIDDCLCGGLPFGSVVNITGKTGEGKSTIASWIIANAIENNYRCFVYSGEIDKSLFKEGLDRQIAGERVLEIKDGERTEFALSDDDQKAINNWYRGKCYFYDCYSLAFEDAESESESLTTKIESSCLQYGCSVFLIDNLMVALDQEQGFEKFDKYEKQSKFMKRLVSIAIRYKVLILLVAHNRKDNSGSTTDNVSGSADISNLAAVTLDYTKAGKWTDKKGNEQHPVDCLGIETMETQRLLRLGKNRFFSTICQDGWATWYNIKSNRVFITSYEKEKVFSCWNFRTATDDEMEVIPFD